MPTNQSNPTKEAFQGPNFDTVSQEHSYSNVEHITSPSIAQTVQKYLDESTMSQSSAQNSLNTSIATNQPLSELADSLNLQSTSRGRKRVRNTIIQPRVRKRVRDESSLKRNIIKRKKKSGEAYYSYSGTEKRAKLLKIGCGENCKRHCHQLINQAQREKLFHEFWGTCDVNRQNDFLCKTIELSQRIRLVQK